NAGREVGKAYPLKPQVVGLPFRRVKRCDMLAVCVDNSHLIDPLEWCFMGSIIAAITLCQRGWKINRKVFQSKTTLPCMTHTALHFPHKQAWVMGLKTMPYFPSECGYPVRAPRATQAMRASCSA